MTIVRATDPFDWPGLLALITRAFAGMEGQIDPPSSLHRLTPSDIATQARTGEVWVVPPLRACMFLTLKPGRLHLGKLAVDPAFQGQGLGGRLVTLAEVRARDLGLAMLELETRVELTGNHAVFKRLGFVETGRKSHAGFDRPTSITFAKRVS